MIKYPALFTKSYKSLGQPAFGKNIKAKELKDPFLGKEEKVEPKSLMEVFTYHKVKMESMIKVGKVAKTTLDKDNYCQLA